jgi:hypothetical protein
MMMRCDLCGNENDRVFEVRMARKTYIFDTFQCAIQFLAPTCAHCACRVIGHGLRIGDAFYCGAHCAAANSAEKTDAPVLTAA